MWPLTACRSRCARPTICKRLKSMLPSKSCMPGGHLKARSYIKHTYLVPRARRLWRTMQNPNRSLKTVRGSKTQYVNTGGWQRRPAGRSSTSEKRAGLKKGGKGVIFKTNLSDRTYCFVFRVNLRTTRQGQQSTPALPHACLVPRASPRTWHTT